MTRLTTIERHGPVTNSERRVALNLARENALAAAQEMDVATDVPPHFRAAVWAQVANALKDGDPAHDGPDGSPSPILSTETR